MFDNFLSTEVSREQIINYCQDFNAQADFRNKEKSSNRKPRELVPLKSPNSSYQVFWDVNDSLTIPLIPFNLKV